MTEAAVATQHDLVTSSFWYTFSPTFDIIANYLSLTSTTCH